MMNIIVSHAQNREDIILDAFLFNIHKGFYVDVGAAHPDKDSVTKYFYEKGWNGINVEPNQDLHRKLEAARSRDTNINAGVSSKKGSQVLRIYSGSNYGLSTFSDKTKKQYEDKRSQSTERYKDVKTNMISLKEILSEHNVSRIDFLKIDVEGAEEEVIKSNDWKQFRPRVICIEANHMHSNWKKLLHDANYFLAYNDGLNEYYLANEEKARQETFVNEYLRLAVGSHIVRPELKELVGMDGSAERRLNKTILDQKTTIERQRKELKLLKEAVNATPGIKNAVKILLQALSGFLAKKEHGLKRRMYKHGKPRTEVSYIETGGGPALDAMYYDYGTFKLSPRINLGWYISYKVFAKTNHYLRKTTKAGIRTVKRLKKAIR